MAVLLVSRADQAGVDQARMAAEGMLLAVVPVAKETTVEMALDRSIWERTPPVEVAAVLVRREQRQLHSKAARAVTVCRMRSRDQRRGMPVAALVARPSMAVTGAPETVAGAVVTLSLSSTLAVVVAAME